MQTTQQKQCKRCEGKGFIIKGGVKVRCQNCRGSGKSGAYTTKG